MNERYSVIFEGRILPGKDLESVKRQLKADLKTDDQSIAKLFIGTPVTIRKNTDLSTAEKFSRLFAAAGAICEIKKENAFETPAPPQPAPALSTIYAPLPPPTANPPKAPCAATALGGRMIVTNIESVPGRTLVEHFGLVSGSTIRAKHIGRDIMASLKNLVGGELKGYTQLLQESRKQAMERMIEEARLMGANAVVNVRFSTSSVAQGAAELYAYGTAIRVE